MAFAHSPPRHRRRGHNPLLAPLLLLALAAVAAVAFIGYVLKPRWPDVPVALDAPTLPIVVAGTSFAIEPAAIRMPVQRHPGVQERVDLAYVWPTLTPPAPEKPAPGAPPAPLERLFVTVQAADGTLPPVERVETIYPRYLVDQPVEGPPGLTLRAFRDDSPYKGEELAFESQNPARFLARCARHGAVGAGNCLLERRIGDADITFRFPRDWLNEWRQVGDGIDRLLQRLHPGG